MSIFRHSREIAAPPSAVFEVYRNPERLARWWGPSGFSNTMHIFEFQNGGRWIFTMHGPDGTDYPNESEFVQIVPNERIHIRHLNLPHFDLEVTFAASGDGTLLSWVAEFENKEFAEKMRDFLEKANEQNFDRLEVEVARGK